MQVQASEPIRHQHQREVDKRHGNYVHLHFGGRVATFQADNGRQIRQQRCAEIIGNLKSMETGKGAYLFTKMNFNEFTKSTAVVVSHGFGISKGFQDGIGIQKSLFDWTRTPSITEVTKNVLLRFCLACSTFTRDDDGLRCLVALKIPMSFIS